jgi:UDP-N-acetylglucosamine 2-epimerase
MAPVVRRLGQRTDIESLVCVTAQHRHMLDEVLEIFDIRPDRDLDVMRSSQGLTYITTAVLQGLAGVLDDLRPDRVLVQGDTTTAMAASLAAFYAKIPVGHIEAGLRTGNIHSPWPEEMNRRLTASIADIHFAPTAGARSNLLREGVDSSRVLVTGNTVIDALFDAIDILNKTPIRPMAGHETPLNLDPNKRIILITGHRRENFAGGLERVAHAIRLLARRGDVEVVYPVHLNPHVQQVARSVLGNQAFVHLIPPVDYLSFVDLMRRSTLIVTDSGGVQEEAPSLGKPVLVTRDTTERPEAVEAGTVQLVGTDPGRLVAAANKLLDDADAYAAMTVAHNPYGDGHAAARIVEALTHE